MKQIFSVYYLNIHIHKFKSRFFCWFRCSGYDIDEECECHKENRWCLPNGNCGLKGEQIYIKTLKFMSRLSSHLWKTRDELEVPGRESVYGRGGQGHAAGGEGKIVLQDEGRIMNLSFAIINKHIKLSLSCQF